jgi:hypothetical protein
MIDIVRQLNQYSFDKTVRKQKTKNRFPLFFIKSASFLLPALNICFNF